MTTVMWNKLWAKITTSSIWEEDPIVRVVWVSLLSAAGADGIARVNPVAVYRLANVSKGEADRALEVLSSPDPQSSSKNDEGRRIRVLDGEGILLINHEKHHVRSPGAERQARYRKRKASRNGDGALQDKVTTRPDQTRPNKTRDKIPPTPQETQGQPTVWRTLAGWDMPEGLESEAVMAGVPAEVFRARIAELENRPIGGASGVLDRTKYVRQQFGRWRTWSENARAKATQASAGGFASRGGSVALLVPEASHERFSAKYGIDLPAVVKELNEAHIAEKLGAAGAKAELQKRLVKLSKGKR